MSAQGLKILLAEEENSGSRPSKNGGGKGFGDKKKHRELVKEKSSMVLRKNTRGAITWLFFLGGAS